MQVTYKILISKYTESWTRSRAIAKADYRNHEVKPANPFLILRRPGDYA
ncbi:hypothetical protein [Nostoc sp. CALU 546]